MKDPPPPLLSTRLPGCINARTTGSVSVVSFLTGMYPVPGIQRFFCWRVDSLFSNPRLRRYRKQCRRDTRMIMGMSSLFDDQGARFFNCMFDACVRWTALVIALRREHNECARLLSRPPVDVDLRTQVFSAAPPRQRFLERSFDCVQIPSSGKLDAADFCRTSGNNAVLCSPSQLGN